MNNCAFFQTKEEGEKGYLRIEYETEVCSPLDIKCFILIRVIYRIDGNENTCVIRKDGTGVINGNDYENLKKVNTQNYSLYHVGFCFNLYKSYSYGENPTTN